MVDKEEEWKTDKGKHDEVLNRRFKVIKVRESSIPVEALFNPSIDKVRADDKQAYF